MDMFVPGDAEASSIIAQAVAQVFSEREFDEVINRDETPFRVERVIT